MKRKILSLVLLTALFVSLMTSCLFSSEYEVTYDYAGARDNVTVTVAEGSLLPEASPTREGYVFGGWYTDAAYSSTYDFSKPVTEDFTVYAKWIPKTLSEVDYVALINGIPDAPVRATVRLTVEKYDVKQESAGLFGGIIASKTNVGTSTGSGVVYAEEAGYYYCLTNNHVVAKGKKTNADITVTDYQAISYTAELVCADANYDLAVVKFKKNAAEPLRCVEIERADTALGETVIAIGAPSGQLNAVTLGVVKGIGKIATDGDKTDISNVTFPVIQHTAPIDSGSSGGVLLNSEYRLIGINYAAATEKGEGSYAFGCAVPTEKIIEFLTANALLK